MNEDVTIELFSETYLGFGDTRMSLPDAVEWLKGLLAQVPEEHRGASFFAIDSETDYDDSARTTLRIGYTRPITPAEIAAREENRRRYIAEQRAATEARDRAEYERLQRKYAQ